MKIIVIGCGRIGADLAYNLFKRGHQVSVIDENAASFKNLPSDFEGKTLEGDAINQDLLTRAGIQTCDALAAVTNNDALNVVVSHVAKNEFNVKNVVARNYDTHLRSIFETFNIQVISSSSWGAQRIEELLLDAEGRTVFSAGNGEVEIYEIIIPPSWNEKKVSDLVTCSECKWLAVTRAGSAFLPDQDTVIKAGDILTVAATFEGITETRENLRKRQVS
ncbi:MAG TPA: TrkA family potassium uptake protein [Anaerolineaceae bacterium]|jgi:trk system potassium uptake protein TrkA|nr:TrkA family potassium uptake protein [Chloroflexota bacterium]HNS06779.1 TrkA family potassium uptake protein [Anaerolineaceae bacterium]HNW13881.1 TrkA family potassium uptake protein [Anaerolineaceae bacterium]HOE03025.1 TrkA family potassium uptake protein [Anaerolineaceae bacterium]HQF68697.1 TrkA family potassium uptake protein [Anaerolineaceae bacterium]